MAAPAAPCPARSVMSRSCKTSWASWCSSSCWRSRDRWRVMARSRPGLRFALLVLGGSLLSGAVLGLALGQYVRAIQSRLEWVLLVFGFVVSQAFRLAGFDPVL